MNRLVDHCWRLAPFLGLLLSACGGIQPPTQPSTPARATSNAVEPTPTAEPTVRPAASPTAPAVAPVAAGPGPVLITGNFTYTNDIITTYYVEHAVALVDMYGFTIRDEEWELPVEGQTLGYLDLDDESQSGEFWLQLPARPAGRAADVDQDGDEDERVQVFALAYSPNLTGGPFSEGDDRSFGWPSYLASVRTDSENQDEVVGGQLVVWAPESGQQFPTGFGPDGLLFTDDDPLGPLPAGYAVIDLDQEPFGISQAEEVELTLYEPDDAAVKDYSNRSYTEAFDRLFQQASTEWAFKDIPEKAVDWEALYDEIAPLVAEADQNNDEYAFFKALQAFAYRIPDGHVGVSGPMSSQDFVEHISSGYGFAIRELDDGRVIAVYVTRGGPADRAGMQVGAEILRFDGQAIAEAIADVQPYAGPFSMESTRRYEQAHDLLRAPAGTEAQVMFVNPGGQRQTAALVAVEERDSYLYTWIYKDIDREALPVEAHTLDSGIGYIKINSNYDDLGLIIRLFERALKMFEDNGVGNLILDLRHNSGGASLGLAGFLTEKEITMGQLEYYSEATGQFEPEGNPGRVLPNENQYSFDKIAILVGPACASACELEAYAFSQVPGAVVVGMYPSAGVEAEVARGQFELPDGIHFQLSTGRFVNPDGSLFLEGTGVQPTVRVPITEETLLTDDDVELLAAEDFLLGVGEGSLRLIGGPVLLAPRSAQAAVSTGASFLEDVAHENYGSGYQPEPGETLTYTVDLESDQRLVWLNGWCAADETTLDENFNSIDIEFSVNDQALDLRQFAVYEGPAGDQACRLYYTVVYRWPRGQTQLVTQVTFTAPIDDGTSEYLAGTRHYVYTVNRP